MRARRPEQEASRRQRAEASSLLSAVVLVICLVHTQALSMSLMGSNNKGVTVIAGATGYIGKSAVRESVRQGYKTFALIRDRKKIESKEGKRLYGDYFDGAQVVEVDVADEERLLQVISEIKETEGEIDSVVSCLASRSGIKREAYNIDYQATLNCLNAGMENDAKHFVLLSAICVRKPLLHFQRAKLKFEAALQAQDKLKYSIVRPTAFFKSVSGQLERLQEGKSFLMFQDSTRANPIAESDLATYLIDCIADESRHNKVLNLGGPDKAMTKLEQGEMMFRSVSKEPKYSRLPVGIFDVSINALQWLADVFQNESLENAAELGRIGKYYAVEDMVTTEPTEMYGTITLQEHFDRIAKEGQEYDPYTTMTGIIGLIGKDGEEQNNGAVSTSDSLQPTSILEKETVGV